MSDDEHEKPTRPDGQPVPPRRVNPLAALIRPGAPIRQSSVPDPAAFTEDEPPTAEQGLPYIHRMLIKYYDEMAPEDQPYWLKQGEQYAARNRK